MIVIAVLLIAAAGVLTAGVVVESTESATLQIFGLSVDASGAGIFLAGAGAMLAFLVGLWMLRYSLARARRRRMQTKQLQRSRQEEVASLQAQKDKLSAELEHTRQVSEPEGSARQDLGPQSPGDQGPSR